MAPDGEHWISLRRRLSGPEARLDFPLLTELAADGATDYFAELVRPGGDEAFHGGGIGYSFATDRADGFSDDDIAILSAVLPVVSLAMRAYAGYAIAAGPTLQPISAMTPAGVCTGGAVERGSVETISAVLWNRGHPWVYADRW